MSLICFNVTTWITQTVLDPVDTWVTQQQQECKQLPWWDPRKWLCWFVTILVKVVVWVTRTILVPIVNVICNFITFVVGWIAMVIAVLIVAINPQSNAIQWVNRWFLTQGRITFVSRTPSTKAGAFDYVITCHCRHHDHTLNITAVTDDDAAVQARVACIDACA